MKYKLLGRKKKLRTSIRLELRYLCVVCRKEKIYQEILIYITADTFQVNKKKLAIKLKN